MRRTAIEVVMALVAVLVFGACGDAGSGPEAQPVEQAPQKLGEAEAASWRAQWTRDDRRLIVTVSEAPTLEPADAADDDPVVQLSLSLEPTGGAVGN